MTTNDKEGDQPGFPIVVDPATGAMKPGTPVHVTPLSRLTAIILLF